MPSDQAYWVSCPIEVAVAVAVEVAVAVAEGIHTATFPPEKKNTHTHRNTPAEHTHAKTKNVTPRNTPAEHTPAKGQAALRSHIIQSSLQSGAC